MSDTAEDLDLSGLTSDFPASSEAAAAASTVTESSPAAETSEGDGASTGTEAQNVAQGSGDEAPKDDGPLDLAKLQALAAKRRETRPEPSKPTPDPEAPAALTAEAIAQAVTSGNSQIQEAVKALDAGDLTALVRALKGDAGDAAGAFERFGRHAMDPEGAKASDTIARLQAEIAELKESQGKLPDDVLTTEKLQQMQQEQAYAQNRRAFLSSFDNAEKYPTLSKVDNEEFRLQCGHEAQQAIEAAGHQPTTELLAQIAEQVASSKLAGLLGQNRGPAPKTEGGSELPKAAGDAATGAKTEGTGEIDNRAASTTAATMPDPDDEDAWERRLTSIAAGSRAP